MGSCLESVIGEGEYWEVCGFRDRAVLWNDGALWGKQILFSVLSWLQQAHLTSWRLWIASLIIW